MTPQAFSYPTVGYNNMIYVPPYGLHESIDYMIKIDPINFNVVKIPLKVDSAKKNGSTVLLLEIRLYFFLTTKVLS